MKSVRVLVIDAHDEVRRALVRRLDAQPGIAIVGDTGSPLRGVDLAAVRRPDVILFDVRKPAAFSTDLCARILRSSPGSKLVVFVSYLDPVEELAYLRCGASKVLIKGLSVTELTREIGLLTASPDGARQASATSPFPRPLS